MGCNHKSLYRYILKNGKSIKLPLKPEVEYLKYSFSIC